MFQPDSFDSFNSATDAYLQAQKRRAVWCNIAACLALGVWFAALVVVCINAL